MQYGENRLSGLMDLLSFAHGATVLDIACNRGLVGFEFARKGAKLIHGCDRDEMAVKMSREILAEFPNVQSRFEVTDLTKGAKSIEMFNLTYDIVFFMRIFHKLERVMTKEAMAELLVGIARKTSKYLAWRGDINTVPWLEQTLLPMGLKRIHFTQISELGTAVVWAKK